jgi:hypothetical protein
MSALVLGASAQPTEYDTPDGTITFILPAGYYMNDDEPFSEDEAFVYEDGTGWSLEALKDGLNGEEKSYHLNILASDAEFESKVDEFGGNDVDESYTETASGNKAWIGLSKEFEGRYNALIDLSNDKVILINSIPKSDSTQPQAGMTADQFKEFVESISID